MCSVFVEYGRILRSVGHLGIISTHEAQGVSLRVCESASLREADPPPPFLRFPGLMEILVVRGRPVAAHASNLPSPSIRWASPRQAFISTLPLPLPFLSLPHDAESRPAVEGKGWADANYKRSYAGDVPDIGTANGPSRDN
jgi:hypothetical protein